MPTLQEGQLLAQGQAASHEGQRAVDKNSYHKHMPESFQKLQGVHTSPLCLGEGACGAVCVHTHYP